MHQSKGPIALFGGRTMARDHGIHWPYHILYHLDASMNREGTACEDTAEVPA